MDDYLAPLRPLADPSVELPFSIDFVVDHVCGKLGVMKFAVLLHDDGKITAMLAKMDGSRMTDANVAAFCRRWGVQKGEFLIKGRSAAFEVALQKVEDEMITPKIDDRGLTAAVCTCDVCGREAHERAKFQHSRRGAADRQMDEGQVRLRLQGKGWTYVKNVLRCPACEADRKSNETSVSKEKPMTKKTLTVVSDTTVPAPQIEPSREQKRQIMTLLDSAYDTGKGRYAGTETDASVAEALGKDFKIDWVSQIREEFFGPDGNDTVLLELAAEMAEIKAEITKAFERSAEAHNAVVALNDRLDKAMARLDAVTGVRK